MNTEKVCKIKYKSHTVELQHTNKSNMRQNQIKKITKNNK